MIYLAWNAAEWDAFGSVIGGTFAGLAFGATLFLLAREARNRRRDEEARERQQLDDESRLARLIVCESGWPNTSGGKDGWVVPVRIKNYSDYPVFDLRVWINDRDVFVHVPMLEPHAERSTECATFIQTLHSHEQRRFRTHTIFLDSNGRWWERSGLDQPQRIIAFDPARHVSKWRPYRPESSDLFPSGNPLP